MISFNLLAGITEVVLIST